MAGTIVGIYEISPPFPATAIDPAAERYGMHGGFLDAIGGAPDEVEAAEKLKLVRYAQEKRYRIEQGGFTLDGLQIAMDDHATLLTLLGGATMSDTDTVMFIDKGVNYGEFTGLQIRGMLSAMKTFLASTFEVLGTVLAGIVAGTITTTAEIDAAAWPS